MPQRLLVFVLFVFGLLVPTIASARTPRYAGTRVGAFDLAVHLGIGLCVDQAAEKHRGIDFTCDEIASGSPHAAGEIGAGGRGTVTLFHGTTEAGAQSILSEGLLPVSKNTAPFPAGSFFTHAGAEGQVAASHWAARSAGLYGGRPVLLQGTMSQELFNSLSSQGLIRTGAVPGLPFFPQQTVILPGGLGPASGGIQWSVAPLTF